MNPPEQQGYQEGQPDSRITPQPTPMQLTPGITMDGQMVTLSFDTHTGRAVYFLDVHTTLPALIHSLQQAGIEAAKKRGGAQSLEVVSRPKQLIVPR